MTCKIVPEMTYNVSSGTLSLYTTTTTSLLNTMITRQEHIQVLLMTDVTYQIQSCLLLLA